MKLDTAPTGKIIEGDVLDVNRKSFDQALRSYDPLLYTKWNPKKAFGWGCWEIRRRPESKVVVDYAEYNNDLYLRCEYSEIDIVNHVLDVGNLSYAVLAKIKSMDTWNEIGPVNSTNVQNWISQSDAKAKDILDAKQAQAKDEMSYNLRQAKKQMNELREAVLSGVNPHLIVHLMGQLNRK